VTNAIGIDAIVGAGRIRVEARENDVTPTGDVGSQEHRASVSRAAWRSSPCSATGRSPEKCL
jgi:hypothetical protein